VRAKLEMKSFEGFVVSFCDEIRTRSRSTDPKTFASKSSTRVTGEHLMTCSSSASLHVPTFLVRSHENKRNLDDLHCVGENNSRECLFSELQYVDPRRVNHAVKQARIGVHMPAQAFGIRARSVVALNSNSTKSFPSSSFFRLSN
jgi:hypothetical protein